MENSETLNLKRVSWNFIYLTYFIQEGLQEKHARVAMAHFLNLLLLFINFAAHTLEILWENLNRNEKFNFQPLKLEIS